MIDGSTKITTCKTSKIDTISDNICVFDQVSLKRGGSCEEEVVEGGSLGVKSLCCFPMEVASHSLGRGKVVVLRRHFAIWNAPILSRKVDRWIDAWIGRSIYIDRWIAR